MKKLIINADEFGLTEGTNKGIIEAYHFGTLTSTTMIVNMWAFDDAVNLARKNPGLGIGLHLNFTDGKPISSPDDIVTLVDKNGYFYNRRELIKKMTLGLVMMSDIEREFYSQIDKIREVKILPTHIDTHQFIMLHPMIFKIVIKFASILNIPIRIPQINLTISSTLISKWLKIVISSTIYEVYRYITMRYKVKTTDRFYLAVDFHRYWSEERLIDIYSQIFSDIKNGVSELMVHPGYYDSHLVSFMGRSEDMARQREEELKALLNPEIKRMIYEYGFKMINFGDIG